MRTTAVTRWRFREVSKRRRRAFSSSPRAMACRSMRSGAVKELRTSGAEGGLLIFNVPGGYVANRIYSGEDRPVQRLASVGESVIVKASMIAKTISRNLLAIADASRAATGASWSEMSKEFYGNSDFFQKLRAGDRSISAKTLDKMIKKFRRKWPKKADWPFVRAVWMTREQM
jgi:hypothetical protein